VKNVLILLIAYLLAGCSPSTQKKSWSEVVDLGNGKTLTIQRKVEFETSNSWSGDAFGMRELKSTLSFDDLEHGVPTWTSNLMPVLLYQDSANQQWVVVTTTFNCDIWREQGQPRPPYWEFRLVDGMWRAAESLSPNSFSRSTNLFFRYEKEVPQSPISISVKDDILKQARLNESSKQVPSDAKLGC